MWEETLLFYDMLVEELIDSVKDEAKEHKIKDVIVGLRQTLVVLDDLRAGLCMTLRGAYSSIPLSAYELIQFARSSNPLQASIGTAALNAFFCSNGVPVSSDDTTELMDLKPEDKVAMIGNMLPLLPRIQIKVKETVVFEDNPFFAGHETLPWWAEKLELPSCDVVLATGVSFANKSTDEILQHSKKARYRAIIGPSTPMSPILLGPQRFDFLGGIRIKNLELAKEIIQKGGGTRELKDVILKTYLERERKNISAIILAAGASERFGFKPKALLKVGDKTFLETILEKLETLHLKDIVVVVGANADEIISRTKKDNIRLVYNPVWQSGMLSSIVAGLDGISRESDAVMIHPVDFPLVRQETYKQLIEKWLETKRGIVSPSYKGRLGHPVIVSCGYFDEIRNAPRDKGARAVIHGYEGKKDLIVVDVNDPYVRMDIDTEEEYKNIMDRRTNL